MKRFYSTLGIDNAIKEQERDNIKANNMLNSTKTWQEEFDEKFNHPNLWCDCAMEYDNERQRNGVKQFISGLINQTREETIRAMNKSINDLMQYAKDNWENQDTVNEAYFAIAQLNKLKELSL